MIKDMSRFMKFIAVRDLKCGSCGKTKWNTPCYMWHTMMTEKQIEVCQNCAIREEFGSKYSQNKRYKQWKERSSK